MSTRKTKERVTTAMAAVAMAAIASAAQAGPIVPTGPGFVKPGVSDPTVFDAGGKPIDPIPLPADPAWNWKFYGDYAPSGKMDSRIISVSNGWTWEPGNTVHPVATPTPVTMFRFYYVYVPASYHPGTPAPVVVVLHAGGSDLTGALKPTCHTADCITLSGKEGFGTAPSVWTTSSANLNAPWKNVWNPSPPTLPVDDANFFKNNPNHTIYQSLADEYGILVAIPNGANQGVPNPNLSPSNPNTTSPYLSGRNYDGSGNGSGGDAWNDCTGNFQGWYQNIGTVLRPNWILGGSIDDVTFINQMLQKMETTDGYSINTSKIYVTGASNGGNMSHRLARELPGVFAAAAAAISNDGATAYTLNGATHLRLQDTCTSTVNSQSNPVPLWFYKGEYDRNTVYHGGVAWDANKWFIPYESHVAGHPEWSNETNCAVNSYPSANGCNTPTDNNITFMSQNLQRYALQGTTPTTTILNTNPRPNDPTPASIYNSDPSKQVIVKGTLDGSGPVADPNTGNYPPVDSVLTCDQYGGNTRSRIMNCVATYEGHLEPSWAVPVPQAAFVLGGQNLDIDAPTENWKFFQHFTLSGYVP